jgi:uncharacterized protein
MRVNVGRISREKGGQLELELEERFAPLETPGGTIGFAKPVAVTGVVTNTGKCLVVEGTIRTEAELVCDRCLEKFRRTLEVPFEMEFFRQTGEESGEERTFLEEAGNLYRGEEFELTEPVREEISLALPMQNLCREECAGLCERCGANLNETTCSCDHTVVDARLAGLEEWLKRNS